MIYITGDTHGEYGRFSKKRMKKQGMEFDEKDYIIVCGDFGLCWAKDKTFDYHCKNFAEKKYTMEKKKKAEEHRQFLQGLNESGFWHYCECCGQKKFMAPQEAFDEGWDYPPKMGVYAVISPRTCGKCSITDTVWWKLNMNKEQKISLEDLSDREKAVINRIIFEPYSLLEEETEDEEQ